MKKVLIIANLFHASPRIPGLCNYLSEFGWQPFIITPPFEENDKKRLGLNQKFFERTKIINAPYKGDVLWPIRKLFKRGRFEGGGGLTEKLQENAGFLKRKIIHKLLFFYQSLFGYPDTEKTWFAPALKEARKILEREKFDAIISSSPYPITHLIAKKIKEESKIPWLADFRDPWSQNHNYPYGPIRKFLDTQLEKETLTKADAITAASPGYAKEEENLLKRPVVAITNGFDPDQLQKSITPLTEKFTITYTGTIYSGKQDPTKIFLAIKELIDEKEINPNEIEIRFYGSKQEGLSSEIQKYGLKNIAVQYGHLSREESLKKQRESQLLLLFCWEDLKETGVYPLKVFEYLAAQRPILATGGSENEDVKKIIEETKAGVSAISIEEIKNCLKIFYQQYKKTGEVPYHGDLKKIEQYSYRSMAKKFAELLNQITK